MTNPNPAEYSVIPTSTIFIGSFAMAAGWLVYGNIPYPEAAALPGAVIGLSIALCFGREDWQHRWKDFLLFGAVGWSLGGMMPLQHLIGFTNTGAQYWGNMLYGTAGLSLVGFIWTGVGGLFTAVPAVLKAADLRVCRQGVTALVAVWAVSKLCYFFEMIPFDPLDLWVHQFYYLENPPDFSSYQYYFAWFHFHKIPWLTPFLYLIYGLIHFVWNRNHSRLSMVPLIAVFGWFLGVFFLVWFAELRLSPPQSDAWSGLLGVLLAVLCMILFIPQYRQRYEWQALLFIVLVTAFWGAVALPLANTFRLYIYCINALYPSTQIMLISQGLLNGIGLSIALSYAATYLTPAHSDHQETRWKSPGILSAGLLLLLGNVVYFLLITPLVRFNHITLYPGGVHIACWMMMALVVMWMTILAIRWVNQDLMKPVLPVIDAAAGRWLLVTLIWMTTILFLTQNIFIELAIWLSIIVWMVACTVTVRTMVCPEPVHAPLADNPWQRDVRRRTVHHVLSWVIITAMFIGGLTAFHTNLIAYPTKGHYFRFGPNAWYPGIVSFLYSNENRESE